VPHYATSAALIGRLSLLRGGDSSPQRHFVAAPLPKQW